MTITHDTVIVIAGASTGIGRALALELARRGACTALLARREDMLRDVAAQANAIGGEAIPIPCDITVREQFAAAIRQAVGHFGQIDVLVNNAGRGNHSYIIDTTEQQIENVFRVNAFSLWYGTQEALKYMLPQRKGLIVTIGSLAGEIGYPANAVYVAAKHAAVGFTRALRAELTGTGVEGIIIHPAGTLTEWVETTEGGAIGDLFAYEARRGAEIAAERGMPLPPQIPLLRAEEVAASITHYIEHPQPECYTHPGAEELVRQHRVDQVGVENLLGPFRVANREGYYDGDDGDDKDDGMAGDE